MLPPLFWNKVPQDGRSTGEAGYGTADTTESVTERKNKKDEEGEEDENQNNILCRIGGWRQPHEWIARTTLRHSLRNVLTMAYGMCPAASVATQRHDCPQLNEQK